ncbi:acetylxylan esterase [Antribacter sp. KLBMP9083]|uniref:Acetylxylan esterase n=1 Tax=Antribacter soli TaxID=2910976 RepID=A0AA41QAM6_9MICO|nr:acetylxylan esterase [Antribacter soli]MCF4119944.1 acetylxylan esterase [Antribacter soli]
MALFDLPLADLETYRPEIDEPDDFDAFWTATLDEARAVGGTPTLERVDTGLTQVVVDDVTFPGFGGHPVKAWLARPANADGPLPAVVEFLGYGGGRGLPHERIGLAAAGYAHFVMDTRGQGSGWGAGGGTPDPVGSGPASPGVMTRGILDPHDHYYRRVFTDGVRAVDAVRAIDGIDASSVSVVGASQGGGISVAVAGLVPDLRAAMPDVPFLTHYRHAVQITDGFPYAEITQYLRVHRSPEVAAQVWRTLSYLDGVSFARRARAAALYSVALMDGTCPPSTVYAAFNAWGATTGEAPAKEIDVYPYNGHEGGEAYRFPRHLAWLGKYAA